MPEVKKGIHANSAGQRGVLVKKGAKMSKAHATVPFLPGGKVRISKEGVASMNLEEMLEASNIVELGLRGEQIPVVKSPKAQAYAGVVLKLNQEPSTRMIAKDMQRALTVQIVKRNRKTTDREKSKRLYQAFMGEE